VKNVKKRPIAFTSPKIMKNYVALAATRKSRKRNNIQALNCRAMIV
jgi:hypothetical protein